MKAFPLIFSRTKNEDFVPDFLVRPADLDITETLKYVHNAMQGLDTLNSIRYTAFAAGRYCICGGIACLSKQLVQCIGITDEGVSEYLKDCKGRSLACFIGFAIPEPAVVRNVIPDISLEQYWNTYLEFLKHQWEKESGTISEKLTEPCVELSEKSYASVFKPNTEMIGGKMVIRHFETNPQQILDYYFHLLLNQHRKDASFISDILYRDEWDRLYFKNAAVSEEMYKVLKSAPVMPRSNTAVKPNESPRPHMGVEIKTVQPRQQEGQRSMWNTGNTMNAGKKKQNPSQKNSIFWVAFGVVVVVVLLVIIMLIVNRTR